MTTSSSTLFFSYGSALLMKYNIILNYKLFSTDLLFLYIDFVRFSYQYF